MCNIFTRVNKAHELIRIGFVQNHIFCKEDLNKIDILLSERVDVQAQIFEVCMLFIRSDMRRADRLLVKSDLLERRGNYKLCIHIRLLSCKPIVLTPLQEDAHNIIC